MEGRRWWKRKAEVRLLERPIRWAIAVLPTLDGWLDREVRGETGSGILSDRWSSSGAYMVATEIRGYRGEARPGRMSAEGMEVRREEGVTDDGVGKGAVGRQCRHPEEEKGWDHRWSRGP